MADLDWTNLTFGYHKTDFNIRYYWRDGQWGPGELTADETVPIHIAATCLHYGQEAFEGLKAFEQKNGDVVVFRDDENAKRMHRSCGKTFMEAPPVELFQEAVTRVVSANRRFVPPYGTGAALYVRPFWLGIDDNIGVKPAVRYVFRIFVCPVGPYFKGGFGPDQGQEFLVGVGLRLAVRVESLGRGDRLGKGHERDAQRARPQGRYQREIGQGERGQPSRDVADQVDSLRAQVEQDRDQDAESHGDEGRRQAFGQTGQKDQDGQRDQG